jgi:hypothetical protein
MLPARKQSAQPGCWWLAFLRDRTHAPRAHAVATERLENKADTPVGAWPAAGRLNTGLASALAILRGRFGAAPRQIAGKTSTGGLTVAATNSCVIMDVHNQRKRITRIARVSATLGGFHATLGCCRGIGTRVQVAAWTVARGTLQAERDGALKRLRRPPSRGRREKRSLLGETARD